MMKDLGEASKAFASKHGVGEILLDADHEYSEQLIAAFQAGAMWASRHHPNRAEQVQDVDTILKSHGFGILRPNTKTLASTIVNAVMLADGIKEGS